MINQRWWRAITISGAAAVGALLLGITKVVGIEPSTNLFSTGITPSVIFGIWSLVVAWAIYKNRV